MKNKINMYVYIIKLMEFKWKIVQSKIKIKVKGWVV